MLIPNKIKCSFTRIYVPKKKTLTVLTNVLFADRKIVTFNLFIKVVEEIEAKRGSFVSIKMECWQVRHHLLCVKMCLIVFLTKRKFVFAVHLFDLSSHLNYFSFNQLQSWFFNCGCWLFLSRFNYIIYCVWKGIPYMGMT